MAKSKTVGEKYMSEIFREMEDLTQQAYDTKRSGGNYFNVISDLEIKFKALKDFLEN